MLPIFTTLLAAVPGLLNTGLSLIRDKKQKKENKITGEAIADPTELINKDVEVGVSLSSKRILNIAGTGIIITIAVNDLTANGITRYNLILFGIGVLYSVSMAFVTYLTEKHE